MNAPTRRALLASAALLAGGAAPAPMPPTAITIVSGSPASLTSLELLNAGPGGHFAAAGLQAEVVSVATATSAMQALVAGRAAFARTAAGELFKAAARQSVPLVAIAEVTHDVNFDLVSATDRPVQTPEQLRGRRIGVLGAGSITDTYLDLLLRSSGLAPTEAERFVVGADPASFALVRQGRLDAVILSGDLSAQLRWSGERTAVWSIGDIVSMPGRCYVATRAFIEQQPRTAAAFIRAILASMREIQGGDLPTLLTRDRAVTDIPGPADPALAAAMVQLQINAWQSDGPGTLLRLNPARWGAARDALAAAGIADIPDVTTLFTNRFVEEAARA